MRRDDEETQVSCTLLEYGRRHGLGQQHLKASKGKKEKDRAKAAIAASLSGKEEGEDEAAEEVSGQGWEDNRAYCIQHGSIFAYVVYFMSWVCVYVCLCVCDCHSMSFSL